MKKVRPLKLREVEIGGGFWGKYIEMVREKVLPYQWEAMNDRVADAAKSHCIKNFEIAAGRRDGEYYGMCFQDSDLYKWLEAVGYSLETKGDGALEALADAAIDLIGAAQCPDGYINTYYTLKEPGGRWTNLAQGHELYCGGHLIEAAVAYYSATGKRAILDIAIRFANCVDAVFGLEEGKLNGYPGHQEIELALVKLYQTTGEQRYLRLAEYFIKERGKSPHYFDAEEKRAGYGEIFPQITPLARTYSQSHVPPVMQREAVGHAVRAVYMYSAMADLAAELGDDPLRTACDALFEDVTTKQMYVTGAIGATETGESFTGAYNLPNDLVYGETCASIGLMMFARRMNILHQDAKYADAMERALYNTVLSGISIAGTEFFYVNPLESDPYTISVNPGYAHVKPVRQKWFDCSCCPANIARTVMGLGEYVYGATDDALYVNLYCTGTAKDGGRVLTVETDYPYGDTVKLTVAGGDFGLFLRCPENAPVVSVTINGKAFDYAVENGYICVRREWDGDTIDLRLDMTPKRVYCSAKLQNNIGKTAVMRGPVVYCAEQKDNGETLGGIILSEDARFSEVPTPKGLPDGAVAIKANAYRIQNTDGSLYSTTPPIMKPHELTLIPYFLWANRGENEMRVFIQSASCQ